MLKKTLLVGISKALWVNNWFVSNLWTKFWVLLRIVRNKELSLIQRTRLAVFMSTICAQILSINALETLSYIHLVNAILKYDISGLRKNLMHYLRWRSIRMSTLHKITLHTTHTSLSKLRRNIPVKLEKRVLFSVPWKKNHENVLYNNPLVTMTCVRN